MREPDIEACPEMPSGLDDSRVGFGNVYTEHLKEYRVRCLRPVRDDHDVNAADPQQRRLAKIHPAALQHPVPTNDIAIDQPDDLGLNLQRRVPSLPICRPPVAIEFRDKSAPDTGLMRVCCQIGIKERPINDILRIGLDQFRQ